MLHCPWQSRDPQIISNTVDENGDGEVVVRVFFRGGTLWLSPDGPWNSGGGPFSLKFGWVIGHFTRRYIRYTPITVTADIEVRTIIREYFEYLDFRINNLNVIGAEEWPWGITKPDDYPAYIDSDCLTISTQHGWWGDAYDVSVRVWEDLPVEHTTWGRIKALFQ
jgi:hypothetical protein